MTEASQPLFAPPEAAALLYPGTVMHARMKPKVHRFTYKVFNLLIDIDRLEEANRASALFSVSRFNLVSFHPADHGDGKSENLRAYIDALLAPSGVTLEGGRVLLLCYPRLLGFAFNPISVYFCYAADGEIAAIVYEVRNTFGEMHSYVACIEPGQLTEAGIRQERDKRFYVSPFIDMPMRYHFRLKPPGDGVHVRILETDAAGPILAATFTGKQRALTSFELLKSSLRFPLMTLKVVAGIHFEALRLWLKGVALQTRPPPPPPVSYADQPKA